MPDVSWRYAYATVLFPLLCLPASSKISAPTGTEGYGFSVRSPFVLQADMGSYVVS